MVIDWQALISTSPGIAVAIFALFAIIRWTDQQNKREKERDEIDREEAKRREEFWTQRTRSEKEFADRQVKFLEGRIEALETKLAEKEKEISKLRIGIDALTTDLKEALGDIGRLEEEKKTVESERDGLKKQVGELSVRVQLVEDVQRKVDTDQLDPKKVEEDAKKASDDEEIKDAAA